MSCHPPTRQVGPYQSEDGPHDELTEQLALADLHVKPYANRHIKVYADTCGPHPPPAPGRPAHRPTRAHRAPPSTPPPAQHAPPGAHPHTPTPGQPLPTPRRCRSSRWGSSAANASPSTTSVCF